MHPYSAGRHAGFRLASAGYFGTMGMPIARGRDFDVDDTYERMPVAIVSQALARQSFGDRDPLGARIMCGLDRPDTWMTIVGVVGDVRQESPAATPGPELYMPVRQHPYMANDLQIVARADGSPDAIADEVRALVHAAMPDAATKTTTLEASIDDSIARPRLRATLVALFASIACLVALAGVYALLSYTTAQRTAEFGLRAALGAKPVDVARLVLSGAARLSATGVSIGLAAAMATSRVLTAMLFGVTPLDTSTYVSVLLIALPSALAIATIPALRAAHVDPVVALRSEE